MEMLKCSKCDTDKPDNDFCLLNSGPANRNRRGRSYVCRVCAAQGRNRERERDRQGRYKDDLEWCLTRADKQREHHAKHPSTRRNNYLLKRYGITLDEYREMEKEQGYRCKICSMHISRLKQHKLYVDHNHETGQVRGLLCNLCNILLHGLEDKVWVQNANQYLMETIGVCRGRL